MRSGIQRRIGYWLITQARVDVEAVPAAAAPDLKVLEGAAVELPTWILAESNYL